jgi:transcriptional regulator with XRE-family HTH domain
MWRKYKVADNKDFQAFGIWLTNQRKNKRLTQAEAAKRARISRVRWSQIERGRGRPRKATVRRLVRTVEGRLGYALLLLNYPVKDVELAYSVDKAEKRKLGKAIRDFKDVLLQAGETEPGFTLINI